MNNQLTKIGPINSKTILLLIAFSILALTPALVYGLPASRDLIHHYRIAVAFNEGFHSGNFYPSWLAEANRGYGDVSLRFYPPGLGAVLGLTRLLVGSWYASTLIVFTGLTLAGAFGTYWWAVKFYSPGFAMWAGVFYIFMPYHINELYQSSLVAEYAAVAVLPFAFAFTEEICRGGGRRTIGGLAAAYALLVLFNLPLTVIGSYALLLYLMLGLDKRKITGTLIRFGLAITVGLLASACFWLTVVIEMPWLRPDNESSFSSVNFIFMSFVKQVADTGIWYGNLLAFATIAALLPTAILLRAKERSEFGRMLRTVGILALFSLVMTTVISLPLWEILPKLKAVQLPWRWLSIASMSSAVLLAASIPSWKEIARTSKRPVAIISLGLVAMSLAFTVSHPIREASYIKPQQLTQVMAKLPGLPSVGPWYPKWVSEKFFVQPEQVVAPDRNVIVGKWEAEHRTFQVSEGPATDAKIHTFYYPLWVASAGGKNLPTRPDGEGSLLVSLPPEAVSVDLSFREPKRSLISGIVSVVGAILILLLILTGRSQKTVDTYCIQQSSPLP